MASLKDLKPWFRNQVDPYADKVHDRHFGCLQITLAALGVSAAGGCLVWFTDAHWIVLLVFPVFVAARLLLELMEEIIDEEHEKGEIPRAFRIELSRMASDALLYLPLALISGLSVVIAGLTVAAGLIVEMAGVMPAAAGADRREDPPFGSAERALFWSLIALIAGLGADGPALNVLLLVGIGLAGWTCWRRLRDALAAQYGPKKTPEPETRDLAADFRDG